MQCSYKTTVRFRGIEGIKSLDKLMSATSSEDLKRTLDERLSHNEAFGYQLADSPTFSDGLPRVRKLASLQPE
jgi:hypothetical protein